MATIIPTDLFSSKFINGYCQPALNSNEWVAIEYEKTCWSIKDTFTLCETNNYNPHLFFLNSSLTANFDSILHYTLVQFTNDGEFRAVCESGGVAYFTVLDKVEDSLAKGESLPAGQPLLLDCSPDFGVVDVSSVCQAKRIWWTVDGKDCTDSLWTALLDCRERIIPSYFTSLSDWGYVSCKFTKTGHLWFSRVYETLEEAAADKNPKKFRLNSKVRLSHEEWQV